MDIQNLTLDPNTLNALLQLGGQYLIPAAALLRALYAALRGKLPEGVAQISFGAAAAGVTAGATSGQPDFNAILADILSNTAFTAGLLTFIVLYLLRARNLSWIVDVVIGALLGGLVWAFTVYVLGQDWPWWWLLWMVPAGAVALRLLRFAMRQIVRVVRIAMILLVIGLGAALAAGGFLLLQNVLPTA